MAASYGASLTTIVDLPDECLREVMLRIPTQRRIHLRKVCKKWCEIIDGCWSAVKNLRCIESTEVIHGMFGYHDSIIIATSSRTIHEGVMKHCGEFLTQLFDYPKEPEGPSLQFAAKYCRNLIHLSITVSSKADDKYIHQLLAGNQKLKMLRLSLNFKNAKMCLRTIATDVLEHLQIDADKQNIYPPSILMSQKQIVRKANSLKHMVTYFVDEELIDLVGQKIQLKYLDVSYRGNSLKKDTFHPILKLKNLQALVIRAPDMVVGGIRQKITLPLTDDFLVALAVNLQFLKLLILDASHITDKGLVGLATLPQLNDLGICDCEGVTDKLLYMFARLENLGLSGCSIRDEGVIKLLEKTRTMQSLDVSDTLITNKTLMAAVTETRKRDNGVCLELKVDDTKATPSTITESSPLLEIRH